MGKYCAIKLNGSYCCRVSTTERPLNFSRFGRFCFCDQNTYLESVLEYSLQLVNCEYIIYVIVGEFNIGYELSTYVCL